MAWESWRTVKRGRCEFADKEVALESRLVFAAAMMPDQPPRVLTYRCTGAENCERFDQTTCPWVSFSSSR